MYDNTIVRFRPETHEIPKNILKPQMSACDLLGTYYRYYIIIANPATLRTRWCGGHNIERCNYKSTMHVYLYSLYPMCIRGVHCI